MENFSIPPSAFIFPIILLGIAMHWYMMTWKNKKDQGLVESLGDELGLEFEATPIMLSALLAEFQMVKKSETCEFANCLSGELHGEQIRVFNFQGVEKTITIYGHTVVAVESVKADLPTFQIEPRGYMDQKLCSLTNDTKEMLRGDEDFRCYRVTSSASESRVEQVFTPEVREYLDAFERFLRL